MTRGSLYTLHYPLGDRPRLVIGDNNDYEVQDCSERGLSCIASPGECPLSGSTLEGALRFPDGTQLVVEAVIVRTERDRVWLWFTNRGIPSRVILDQQRYLLGRYVTLAPS